MMKRVNIIQETEVFKQAIFRIIAANLQYERFDGTLSDEMVRLNFERGDSAAVLIRDAHNEVFLLTEQFRYPTCKAGAGWLTEVVAGMIDDDEAPSDTLTREIREEIGYCASSFQHIGTFYVSPGGSSERIHLYYSVVDGTKRKSSGGGVLIEGENIRVVTTPVDQALDELKRGLVMDAKTIIALQWFALNRDSL